MSQKRNTGETSAQVVLQNWIKYYTKNKFGIGIQCSVCMKWRQVYEYEETKDVPEDWNCSMWMISPNEKGHCDIPSSLSEADFAQEEYSPGTLVWAKMSGYRTWPGMIEDSPDTQDFFMIDTNNEAMYHVTFFGEKPCRSWVKSAHVKEFKGPSVETPNKKGKFPKTYVQAIEDAEDALKMSIKERLCTFSFAVRYTGRWAKITDENEVSLPPISPDKPEMVEEGETSAVVNGARKRKKTYVSKAHQASANKEKDLQIVNTAGKEKNTSKTAVKGGAKKSPMSKKKRSNDGQCSSSQEQVVSRASTSTEHDCREYCRLCNAHEDSETDAELKTMDENNDLDQSTAGDVAIFKDGDETRNPEALRDFIEISLDFEVVEFPPKMRTYHEFVKKNFSSIFRLDPVTTCATNEEHEQMPKID